MVYVLGIDGGGTKTTGAIVDHRGRVCAIHTVAGTNLNRVNKKHVSDHFFELFNQLKTQSPKYFTAINVVFAGVAGSQNEANKEALVSMLRSFVGAGPAIIVDNDAINALYAGTNAKAGIVQIAGTGSISFGENEKGERARAGGWGYAISDEGSGYALGKKGLSIVLAAFDGRIGETSLTNAMLEYFQCHSPLDLIPLIYDEKCGKNRIASAGKLVCDEAAKEDPQACLIVEEAAYEHAELIKAVARKLFVAGENIQVVLAGSVFQQASLFMPTLKRALTNMDISWTTLETPPVYGAILAGRRHVGAGQGIDFYNTFLRDVRERD